MNGQEQPLVSVIVPVYNAGMYVKRCVESIFNQKHSNVQVILVNDASTDDSDKICSELSKNDGRIIYLCHDVNKGQTVTRNDGVASATGEWMMFVDADDTIDADAISSMIEFANDSNVDIVFAGYKMILKNGVKIYTANIKEGVYSRNDFVKYIFDAVPSNVITCIGSKLYRMSFIKDRKEVTSDEVKTNYDMAFIIDALISCRKVAYKDKAIYNYIQRSGSITYSYRNDMYRQISVARSKIPLLLKLSGHYEDKCFDYYHVHIVIFIFAESASEYNVRTSCHCKLSVCLIKSGVLVVTSKSAWRQYIHLLNSTKYVRGVKKID